ncbi:hypothetical protein BJ138DRAFT_83079 [Hygrophoropsis aurantiaca]|uniref:Uncharacterized protein n=1 Tax=Hygrophoropsis aurantiaca TaxID=72124 RepID=A0ACB8AB91_9AGAM|nr:hypothetical protein BJ138DRAFT_83079 [Hygrophoropsis aurantiaca]
MSVFIYRFPRVHDHRHHHTSTPYTSFLPIITPVSLNIIPLHPSFWQSFYYRISCGCWAQWPFLIFQFAFSIDSVRSSSLRWPRYTKGHAFLPLITFSSYPYVCILSTFSIHLNNFSITRRFLFFISKLLITM